MYVCNRPLPTRSTTHPLPRLLEAEVVVAHEDGVAHGGEAHGRVDARQRHRLDVLHAEEVWRKCIEEKKTVSKGRHEASRE